ncbi:M protein repeat protein [Ancylostoma caninum]|uniref:M protein repeat protein n=1 Tax=Ancylostoma caninum TaxID=29170 RepID=A0A368F7B4_ANCCA|nr:M protein repeat protein [Ancylostoma caninum]
MAENQLTDQANRLQQYCEENEQLVAKLNRVTNELDVAAKARETDVEKNGNLLKKIANLEMTIAEMTEASEEANKNRSTLVAKLRKAEDEIAALLDAQEDIKQASEKAEKVRNCEIASLKSQIAEARKRFDDELEQHVADLQRKAALKESKELQEQIEAMEKERRLLRLEVDNLASTKDDAGKSMFELEKAKKRLEEELAEARDQIVELEDALQMADDAKTRGEVMLQAAKQDWERQLSQRSEEEEDQRRSLNKRLRELEEEIGIEQRLRTQTLQSKKKLEAQLQTLQEDMEHLAKQNEEANRQLRRVNMIVKEAETEGAEARAAMDEALCKARDFEKRLRTAEAEVSRLTGDLSAVQAARRKVEAERDDLAEELSSIQQGGLIGQDEKKRYEKRIADLQEMVEEEQTSNELVNEKLKKAQAQVEQLTSELTMERSMCERADADKATLERALRDLKVQLQDAEGVLNYSFGAMYFVCFCDQY